MRTRAVDTENAVHMIITMKRVLNQGTVVFRFSSSTGVRILSTSSISANGESDSSLLGSRKAFRDPLKDTLRWY